MTKLVSEKELSLQKENMKQCAEILKKIYPDKVPLCHVHSYGCQGNVADGEKIKGMLCSMGYGISEQSKGADLVLFNTCAVRENAEDRVFGNLGMLIHQKKENKNMIIGLCGCMMQQEHIASRVKKHFPGVNLVFGTHVLHKLPEMLLDILKGQKRVVDISDSEGVIAEGLPVVRSSKLKASVPISYGCNNFCTYCIVPYVRGRERSRDFDLIVKECEQLVLDGCKEIMLLGQNVNSYGKDLESTVNFSDLLKRLNAIPGEFQIRFMTSHPKDATKELIDTMAQCEKVCNHLHLPVQCGSDRVLKLMNRHYSIEQYLDLVEYAKKKIPDISFTSDIIVGFPGETYEDFLDTVNVIKKVQYSSLFTFIYSKREGTKAALMEDPVSLEEKTKWLRELISVQNDISENVHKNYLGSTQKILLDGIGRSDDGMITGRTGTNIIVDCTADKNQIGEFVDVKINKAYRMALVGEIIN